MIASKWCPEKEEPAAVERSTGGAQPWKRHRVIVAI